MNLKSVRLFSNSQRQLSQQKKSPTLHNSTKDNESSSNNLTVDELHNTGTTNFLAMLEIDVRKHWGI